MADKVSVLLNFFGRIASDHRINTSHISLYTFLWKRWKELPCKNGPLVVYGHEVRGACKISSSSTYHRTIRQLHEYGYIKYIPSFNHYEGSKVEFSGWEEETALAESIPVA